MIGGLGGGMGAGMGNLGELTRPEFTARDLGTITEILRLDQGQQMLVEAFISDYEQAHRAEAQRIREEMQGMRERFGRGTDWQEVMEEMGARMRQVRQRQESLRGEFLADLRAVLSEEQLTHWDGYERHMRRQRELPQGVISGESVDLITIVNRLELEDAHRDQIRDMLSDYEVQLDLALQRRIADMPRTEQELQDAMRNMDFDLGLDVIDRQARIRSRIRDVNDSYATQISSLLPQEQSEAFMTAFRQEAFPQVYRPTYGERAFRTAMEIDGVDLTNVEALYATYQARLNPMNERMVRTIRENEPRMLQRQIRMFRDAMNRGERPAFADDPVVTAIRERDEFETEMVDRLRQLLTPEQQELLPNRARRGGGNNMQQMFQQQQQRGGQPQQRGGQGQQRGGGRGN